MKKVAGIFTLVLLVVTLVGCGDKTNTAQSAKQDSTSQNSEKKMESKKKLAKLRSENESLKKRESEAATSSSIKAASESIAAADSSAKAASESLAEANNVSESTDSSNSNVNEEEPVANDGATAAEIEDTLVSSFGCDLSELQKVPAAELIGIYDDVSRESGDIGATYGRIKARYPNIGGNIAGPDANSDDDEVNLDGF